MKHIIILMIIGLFGFNMNGQIVINEINYKDAIGFETKDWIELYNNGNTAVNISYWVFKDNDDLHEFIIPQGTVLNPNSYLVLAQFLADFQTYFPGVTNVIGDFTFGLSGGGELIRLFDNNGVLKDYVAYDDVPPWPTEPDGNGPTLELKNPNLDNALPSSWAASLPPNAAHGTPGWQNSTYILGMDDFSRTTVSISPNPLTHVSEVIIGNMTSPVSLMIYDLLGRETHATRSDTNTFVLKREQFKTGIYILKLMTEDGTVLDIQKLVVK
jgi:hypothetical protein